jgi:hypothetical protein
VTLWHNWIYDFLYQTIQVIRREKGKGNTEKVLIKDGFSHSAIYLHFISFNYTGYQWYGIIKITRFAQQ